MQDEKKNKDYIGSDRATLRKLLRLANTRQQPEETDIYGALLKLFNTYLEAEETDRQFNALVNSLHPEEKNENKEFEIKAEVKPETTPKVPTLYTQDETASILKISLRTLFNLRKNGKINETKVGRSIRYKKEDVERFLNQK